MSGWIYEVRNTRIAGERRVLADLGAEHIELVDDLAPELQARLLICDLLEVTARRSARDRWTFYT